MIMQWLIDTLRTHREPNKNSLFQTIKNKIL